ncbi:MAG: hypothetical protein EAZ89_14370 [Bacteroidetes bacterium]|nr:MAG: hypothetical protein EAZ89_14370 [Bacteroidota bacterium]
MLFLYVPKELIPEAEAQIRSEFRLEEWVQIVETGSANPLPSALHISAQRKEGISHLPDWYNVMPPFLFPEGIVWTRENLLALIYTKLGNYERVYELLSNNSLLLNDIDVLNRLQNGVPVSPEVLTCDFSPFDEYRLYHNSAILHHYAATADTFDPSRTRYFYQEALNAAPDSEYHAFTARHYAVFLLDSDLLEEAEVLIREALRFPLSSEGSTELKSVLCQVWMKQLVLPYDPALLEKLKQTLWEVLEEYQAQGRSADEGLLLVDAAQVANYSDSFAESLGYINKALEIFRREEMPELLAQAQYRKGILLYTWAKNGNPQFFRGAMEAFQEALKVFSREETPEVFADIHQYLGVIYSEIPDEVLKKSIWAGVSSASFQEALSFYRQDNYPYEYAMVCNNYANALTRYPQAVHSDNLKKALGYYEEALEVRTAERWPLERAVSLLNYVETCWHLGLDGKSSDKALYEDMLAKTKEARHLTQDPHVQAEADLHLEKLALLRDTLAAES